MCFATSIWYINIIISKGSRAFINTEVNSNIKEEIQKKNQNKQNKKPKKNLHTM